MKKPETVSEPLRQLIRRIEASFPQGSHRIWKLWPEAVGADLARRCRPVDYRRGKLTVAVSGSSWLQQLTLMSREVREALNRALGEELVAEIRFREERLDTASDLPTPFPTAWRDEPLDTETVREIDMQVEAVADGALKEAIRDAHVMAAKRDRFRAAQAAAAPAPSTSLPPPVRRGGTGGK